MSGRIHTIFMDLGDTLRVIRKDESYAMAAKAEIVDLLGARAEPAAFFREVIEPRYDAYRAWALRFFCEAPEDVLWTRFLAFDFPRERVECAAARLTYAYRRTKGERVLTRGGARTIKELFARGYTLGIISDLVGVGEVDAWLGGDGLRPYFKTVQQSSVCLIRKPHPAIYYYAMQEAGARGEHCCFVGDNLDRDIVGAKAAGLCMTIGVRYPGKKPQIVTQENCPNRFISRFDQLLDLFPALSEEERNHGC